MLHIFDALVMRTSYIVVTPPLVEIRTKFTKVVDQLFHVSTAPHRATSALNAATGSKLAKKKSGASELNQTTLGLNEELETKVRERTKELEDSIEFALLARGEAIKANKLKSQFVANISYEIRTPMSSMINDN